MAMTNELKMIEALENVAKSFGYKMISFSADKHYGLAVHFEEPDCFELKADGETYDTDSM